MKSHQKEKKSVDAVSPTTKVASGTNVHHPKNTRGTKPQKEPVPLNKNCAKQPEASSSSKPPVHRRFKRKPWQKYNARASVTQNKEEETDSSDSDDESEKYRRREIVDNSQRFEDPEADEHLIKEMIKEENKDFSELCEKMRLRENTCELDSPSQTKGNIPSSVVLPKDFEKDLDILLTLNVSRQDVSTDQAYTDPESFSKWLRDC